MALNCFGGKRCSVASSPLANAGSPMQSQVIATAERPLFHLAARTGAGTATPRLFILGNAYGVMPYQAQLASALADRGYESIWFPFSGQPGTSRGRFSIRSGADDLAQVVEQAQSFLGPATGPIAILAHCASGLIAIEYLCQTRQSDIDKLIAYSLLTQPRRLKASAEPRLVAAGVRSGLTDWDWDYDLRDAVAALPNLPVLLCHIGDALNRRRATLAELKELANSLPRASVWSNHRGYDHWSDSIGAFTDSYDSWLRIAA